VNNLYVNATNFRFDVGAWLRTVPLDRVVQIHVAGHEWFDEGLSPAAPGAEGALIVDTHGADVPDPVMALLRRVIARTGAVPVVLERDHHIPALPGLLAELATIKSAIASVAPPAE
jgi:uncharacterized protein (UPF0276 family)